MMRVGWGLAVAMTWAFVACGGGGDGGTDTGGTDTVTPQDPGVQTDTGTDEGRPDMIETDPVADIGPQCTCDTTDACCDGCLPINEGGACGETGNCLVAGSCQAGVCAGAGPLVCEAPGACQEPGVCNPETGGCDYVDRPDQAPCEAIEGLDGSGLCLAGVCYGFGRCDQRTYDQPVGYACNFDAECAEGWCQAAGDDWSAFCTRRCGVGLEACPEGTACVTDGDGTTNHHCRPLNKDRTLPGDGTMPTFAVCNRNEDCEGGLCLSSGGKRFCTQDCEVDGSGSNAACGSCGECRDNGDELQFDFKYYCMPQGSNAIGEPCGMSADCKIAFCQGGLCSGQCIDLGEGVSSCPGDMQCVTGLFTDPNLFVCVPGEQAHRELGQTCADDWSCKEGACREYKGASICMLPCDTETPCPEDATCRSVNYQDVCVPNSQNGVVTQGEACTFGFECVEGAVCYRGACLFGCEGDADCTVGTCFLDAMFRAAYCVPACVQDADCPSRMFCADGACIMSMSADAYLFGFCRADRDCETGVCVGGTCSDACAEEAPCEGSLAPEWAAVNLCQPCNPWNFGADCNGDAWGLNECIQTGESTGFCAPECGIRGAGICPVGTRCYNIDGYTQACVPLTGSCEITSACDGSGRCIRPVGEGMPCIDDIQCAGGRCTDGRCLAQTCTIDADCGCALLACDDGWCGLAAGAGMLEAEPNDDLEAAQVLGGGRSSVVASLMSIGSRADIDLFKVHLEAGQALDVITEPFCGQDADTFLRLVAADGTPLPGWENDDIDPNGWFFSWLNGFIAETALDVYIEVVQSPYVAGFARFNYLLSVNVFTVAQNNTCDGAIQIQEGTEVHDLATAIDSYQVGSCTGYASPGKDLAFRLTVPAMSSVQVTIDAPFDAQLMLIQDCANANETCLTGADDLWEPGLETLLWANPTEMPVDLFLVVDSLYMGGDALFELAVDFASVEPPAWDIVDGAVEILLDTPMPLTLLGAANDYDAGTWGCTITAAMPGADIILYTNFAPGEFGLFRVQDLVGKMPFLYLVTDPGSGEPPQCLASGRGIVQWQAGDEAATVFLVIDQARAHDYANFSLLAQRGPVGDCFGPCDPSAWDWACVEGTAADLCLCDQDARALVPFDCDGYCRTSGAMSGVCHTFTAPGYERDSCMCDYDCSLPNDHCEQGYYTNCSCGAADPCGWKDDSYCNEFCEIEYPADFFDDTLDCTPAP